MKKKLKYLAVPFLFLWVILIANIFFVFRAAAEGCQEWLNEK